MYVHLTRLSPGSGMFWDRTYRRFLEALDGNYRVKLESFLAHARRLVVTSPQKVPSHTSDLVLSTHAVSSILLSGK